MMRFSKRFEMFFGALLGTLCVKKEWQTKAAWRKNHVLFGGSVHQGRCAFPWDMQDVLPRENLSKKFCGDRS
jgi:hypothetical protein